MLDHFCLKPQQAILCINVKGKEKGFKCIK